MRSTMESGPFHTLAVTLGTNTAHSAIVGVVSKLLRKCGQLTPPIELRPITEELGIKVEWAKVERKGAGSVASISSDGGQLVIRFFGRELINSWRRTRFTVAHEIIHAVIVKILSNPELIERLDDSEDNLKRLERLCDIGAAELLMPKTLFRKNLQISALTPSRLFELYDLFMVSREALLLRIAETLPNGCVLRWRKYSRKMGEEVCFRVVKSYPKYATSGRRPWLPEGATTKHVLGFPEELSSESIEPIPTVTSIKILMGKEQWSGKGYFTRWPNGRTMQPVFQGLAVPDEYESVEDSDFYLIFSE